MTQRRPHWPKNVPKTIQNDPKCPISDLNPILKERTDGSTDWWINGPTRSLLGHVISDRIHTPKNGPTYRSTSDSDRPTHHFIKCADFELCISRFLQIFLLFHWTNSFFFFLGPDAVTLATSQHGTYYLLATRSVSIPSCLKSSHLVSFPFFVTFLHQFVSVSQA